MRKVLVPALAASAAAVPAVAFAATTDNETSAATPVAGTAASKHEIHTDTRVKRHNAVKLVNHEEAVARRKAARKRAAARATAAPSGGASPQLEAIAACESGGNPSAIGGGGAYRGKYQFDYGTWASVGGSGDPAAAPESEQDARAAMLLQRSGTTPWPVCG